MSEQEQLNALSQKVAQTLGEKIKGLSQVQKASLENQLVVAFEYFEHIEDAVTHLAEMLRTCSPRYMLIANAFNTTSVGHFRVYRHAGRQVDASRMSKMFNAVLRESGYEQVKTKLWNNKPAYWRKL